MNSDKIDKLVKEKMRLLTKVNTLLEEMIEEQDDGVRNATGELVRQLKSNISEIEEKIVQLEQAENAVDSDDSDLSEDENTTEGNFNDEQDEEDLEEDEVEYEYTDEPSISIGRSDDGTLLAVYDKRRKKSKE